MKSLILQSHTYLDICAVAEILLEAFCNFANVAASVSFDDVESIFLFLVYSKDTTGIPYVSSI